MVLSRRILLLTALALTAFAANSVLARAALMGGGIGPWSFTLIRLVSGAVMLALIAGPQRVLSAGNWRSAFALLAYAALFSFAYIALPAGTGALILFALVQMTMIGAGLMLGERLKTLQWAGAGLAMLGLLVLLGPGIAAPSPVGGLAMALAGIAWGLYSLRGRGAGDPLGETAGNFVKAAVLVAALTLPAFVVSPEALPNAKGVALALASGVITSGIGYAIWYTALKGLSASLAGIAQLSVPALAAAGGIVFVAEPLSARFILASLIILCGIGLVILNPQEKARKP